MSGIDAFAWIVLLTLVATVLIVFAALGGLPGKVARQRGHPQAEAIIVAGWLALIFGFVMWPVVLVWSYLKPVGRPAEPAGADTSSGEAEGADASARIAELEARLANLEATSAGGQAR